MALAQYCKCIFLEASSLLALKEAGDGCRAMTEHEMHHTDHGRKAKGILKNYRGNPNHTHEALTLIQPVVSRQSTAFAFVTFLFSSPTHISHNKQLHLSKKVNTGGSAIGVGVTEGNSRQYNV
jgi:hypothetical protein